MNCILYYVLLNYYNLFIYILNKNYFCYFIVKYSNIIIIETTDLFWR